MNEINKHCHTNIFTHSHTYTFKSAIYMWATLNVTKHGHAYIQTNAHDHAMTQINTVVHTVYKPCIHMNTRKHENDTSIN